MMLKEPGNLSDFGPDAKQKWHDSVAGLVTTAVRDSRSKHFRLLAESDWPDGVSIVDWDGFPRILQNCLGDEQASEFCDWKVPKGDLGRAWGQDEYCEWRTVRNSENRLIRVEVTTELAKYWEILAAYHPMKTLRLLGRFAGESLANWREVYGENINPFAPETTPEQRANEFKHMMEWSTKLAMRNEPVRSPYNNGQKAIAFLSKPVSSLSAAIFLFVHASFPYGKNVSGSEMPLSGPEAIASTSQAAIDCRNSDPNMVGRMNDIVWEGRAVAFDDPVGVYIRSFAHTSLVDPNGNPIPEEWVEFQRGSRPHNGQGEERSQRLVIEVPPGMGFILEDLVSRDTSENIKFGYQIAELTKLACYFKISQENVVTEPKIIVPTRPLIDCSSDNNCARWENLFEQFQQTQQIQPQPNLQPITRAQNILGD